MGGAFGKKKDRRKQKRDRNYLWASSGLEFHTPLSFGGIVFFVFPSYPFIPIFFFCLKKKKKKKIGFGVVGQLCGARNLLPPFLSIKLKSPGECLCLLSNPASFSSAFCSPSGLSFILVV